MNIFFLDEDPKLAAEYHCDKHVVKMILESAQLLCTAVNVKAGEQVTPYKTTHTNHPCSVWVRESYDNFSWLYNLMLELERERRYRWGSRVEHKSITALLSEGILLQEAWKAYKLPVLTLQPPALEITPPALAMPDHCKLGDAVQSYRQYYREEKTDLHIWTNRDQPWWL